MSKSVEHCCVNGCDSVSSKKRDVTFHKFPKPKQRTVLRTNHFGVQEQVDRLTQWKKVLKISAPYPRMRVCSLHFKHTDYVLPDYPSSYKILVKSAVPSINIPITAKEKNNALKNETRLSRIIQRKLNQTYKTANKSLSNELPSNESDEYDRVQDPADNILVDEDQSNVNEEFEHDAVENQLNVTTNSIVLKNKYDPVIALIEKNNKKKVDESTVKYSFSDTLNTDAKMCTATGTQTIKLLETIVNMIKIVHKNRFEQCKMKTRERVILTYMKMKHNTSYKLLALMFTCTSSQVCQKIFLNTIEILNNFLSFAIPWPSRQEIARNLPICFEGFKDTQVVLDCTEIYIQQPKNLCCQLNTYSHYKGAQTVKFLIGVTPAGTISFVSPAYGGRSTDTAIFTQSKLINLLEPNDAIMVDRGFLINELCQKNRWKCVRPPFLQDKKQFSQGESIATSKIAAARFHVECVNQ
ncbi:LOW QUALITY PROTEIN: uncharacterized protein [Prorops nasuta]|uniref:LOW QUALITY PROTEIN: uncharacterized protein n=1 Tax=Prorops nasuta TaxID=863751 RepID=UPI0034CD8CB8